MLPHRILTALPWGAVLLFAACSTTSTVSREDLEARPNVVVVPVEGAPVVIHKKAVKGDWTAVLEELNGAHLKNPSVLFAEECREWLEAHAPLLGEVTLAPSVRLPRAERDDLYRFDDFVGPNSKSGGWGWHSYRWASGDGPPLVADMESSPGGQTWVLETLVSYTAIVNGAVEMQASAKLMDLRTGKKLAHVEPTMRSVSNVVLTDHSIGGTEESIRVTARDLCAEVLALLGIMLQG